MGISGAHYKMQTKVARTQLLNHQNGGVQSRVVNGSERTN